MWLAALGGRLAFLTHRARVTLRRGKRGRGTPRCVLEMSFAINVAECSGAAPMIRGESRAMRRRRIIGAARLRTIRRARCSTDFSMCSASRKRIRLVPRVTRSEAPPAS